MSAGVAGRRVFIFGALEPGKAKKRELIACGEARGDDLFIFTGVPDRDPQSYVRFTINASGEWVR